MKRIYMICRNAVVAGLAWAAILRLPLPPTMHLLVLLAPVLLLIALGCYLLVLLLAGALTFRSCPEEASALHKDITRARDDLIAQGYDFHEGFKQGS